MNDAVQESTYSACMPALIEAAERDPQVLGRFIVSSAPSAVRCSSTSFVTPSTPASFRAKPTPSCSLTRWLDRSSCAGECSLPTFRSGHGSGARRSGPAGLTEPCRRPRKRCLSASSAQSGVVVVLAAFVESGGKDGGFGTAAHAHLRQQVRHVVLDRLLGEVHLVGDLSVGEPVGEQVEDPVQRLSAPSTLKRLSLSVPGRRGNESIPLAIIVGSSSDLPLPDAAHPKVDETLYRHPPNERAPSRGVRRGSLRTVLRRLGHSTSNTVP